MKASDYRAQIEAELADGAGSGVTPTGANEIIATLPAALDLLADENVSVAERLKAFRQAQAATFLGRNFDPYRADYLEALRKAAVGEAPELRDAALESLAAVRDAVGQNLLIEGLADPAKALVPAANALAFLSLDEHSAIAPLARLVLERDDTQAAKVAALRTLAVDPGAQDLLEGLMRDKDEFREVRKISAISLQKLNPTAFQRVAQDIAVDDADFDDIRATAWNGLAATPLAERLLSRAAVRESAEALGESLASGEFKGLLNRLTSLRES